MGTPVNMVKSWFIFGTLEGYLNTEPTKDQHKTFHKSRVHVA